MPGRCDVEAWTCMRECRKLAKSALKDPARMPRARGVRMHEAAADGATEGLEYRIVSDCRSVRARSRRPLLERCTIKRGGSSVRSQRQAVQPAVLGRLTL